MVVLLHPTNGAHAARVPQFAASAARRAALARGHAVKRILSPPNHSRLPSNPGSDSLYESFTQKPENHQMSLLEARKTYKPFEYPWAYDFWKRQQQIHWMPEEVPLGEDCRDFAPAELIQTRLPPVPGWILCLPRLPAIQNILQ